MQRGIASRSDGFMVKDTLPTELDVAFRVLANGSSYVDPRVDGGMLKRRYEATSGSAISDLTSRESAICVCRKRSGPQRDRRETAAFRVNRQELRKLDSLEAQCLGSHTSSQLHNQGKFRVSL